MPNVRIRGHWDVDGAVSAFFTSMGVPNSEIEIADYEKGFGNTTGLTKDDYMVDMHPQDDTWNGTVIDHHLPYPEEHSYTLYSDDAPASLIAWRMFKDKIPKSEWWKLVCGIVGDGQPELIPVEVFDLCPGLLKNVKTSIYQSYGNWKVSLMPLYRLLSSGLNAFMRKGEYESALNLLKYSSSPLDIYTSEDVRIAKLDIRNEFQSAVKDADIFDYENLAVVIYYSKYRMSGYIASSLQSSLNNKTIMAINKRNGSVSLRGDLAPYYQDKFKELKYLEVAGHLKFMGGKLKKNYHTLIKDLNATL